MQTKERKRKQGHHSVRKIAVLVGKEKETSETLTQFRSSPLGGYILRVVEEFRLQVSERWDDKNCS